MYLTSACDDHIFSTDNVGIDEAVVTLSSELSVSVWSQSVECYQVG